ncbi:protein FAR1-RELATED SEQUENCE 1-like [Chenopodium quinoa]|uniref:protein FAR1-RELATED SEQUENCE 1-like n=1 Tax=Chenopodium quinoa TaxID=63459 RepID=UPI000B785272|nr:protein FAR1-RELATED SEQUENCE 1-like [Chenopodium quinoa]
MAETTHRWCIWHILQKFGKYVKGDDDYEVLKGDFDSLIYGSLDADEFEARWCDAIQHYELQDNAWLGVRAEAERMADSNTQRYVRHLVTDIPAEVLFQKCYTDAKFKEVQGQCKKMLYVRPLDQYEIGINLIEFIIEDRVWIKPKNAMKDEVTKIRRCYRVVYDSSTYEVACDCKHFECHGIICRHMILVYDLNGVTVVPEKYVLRRWRKDVQRKHTRVKVAYHDPLTSDEVRNYHNLMGTYEPICSKASICKEAVQAVKEMLQLMDLRVDEVLAMVAKRQLAGGNENGPGEDEGVHGVSRTPSSVAQNKGLEGTNTPMTVASRIRNNNTTPVSGFQGSYEGSAPGRIKDPPLPKKKAHRTTSVRYPSCTEKKGKERAANKAKNDARKKASQAPTSISLGTSEYIRSVGGIQMRDLDGSLGYFTTVRGGHSGGVFASLLGLTLGTSGSIHN